jgi:hypothetical protein
MILISKVSYYLNRLTTILPCCAKMRWEFERDHFFSNEMSSSNQHQQSALCH